MEMHSRQSLKEIHGISAAPRRQPRWLLRLGIAAVLAVPKAMTKVINAELAARRAIVELASMDDRMLRDLGITRGEIRNLIRGPRGNVRAFLSSDAGNGLAAGQLPRPFTRRPAHSNLQGLYSS
jgi:uncharacterized protein YjiS (DUF1127 family)